MLYFPRWKIITVLLVVLLGVIFAAPNFISRDRLATLPDWLPHRQINLGLDLQGGAHLLLEVDLKAMVHDRLEGIVENIRTTLRAERIGYIGLGIADGAATFRLRNPADQERAVKALRKLSNPLTSALLVGGSIDDLIVEPHADGRITVRPTEAALTARKRAVVAQSIEIVRRRIDAMGTREPTIQRQGNDRILVQVPGLENPDRLESIIGQTAKLTFRMVDTTTSPAEAAKGRIPPGSELMTGEPDESGAVQHYVVRKRVMVSGDTLVDAKAAFQQGEPVVSFRFDAAGAKRFGDATKKNVGKPFAIILDNKVISAPRIREPILGGSGVISGSFTVESANDLAILLRAGALPTPLKIIEKRNVGPDLGADSVAEGKIAAIIGFVGVVVFMLLVYTGFGLAADAALIINVILIMGALSLFQATLTLPGIAGIVLTIGMAVDANVLVFERIREEARSGKTPFAALDAGYSRALGTILDANITTLIAAVILFQFGSGPVKGFAVTLAVGIITSVFTAVTLTRLFLVTWLRRVRPTTLPI
jgi:preprotein translocase subunit SecD